MTVSQVIFHCCANNFIVIGSVNVFLFFDFWLKRMRILLSIITYNVFFRIQLHSKHYYRIVNKYIVCNIKFSLVFFKCCHIIIFLEMWGCNFLSARKGKKLWSKTLASNKCRLFFPYWMLLVYGINERPLYRNFKYFQWWKNIFKW